MSLFDRLRGTKELEDEILRLRREIRALERAGKRETIAASSLIAVGRALRDARSMEEFADSALLAILEAASGDRGALILSEESGDLHVFAARTLEGSLPPEQFEFSHGIAKEAASESRPVATGSAAKDPRFRSYRSVIDYAIGSVLCLPIRRRTEPPGVLYLTGKAEHSLRRADPSELVALADLVSIALDRLALETEASRRDRLEAVGLASASIAHDLRTPLQAADLVLDAVRGQGGQARVVESAIDDARVAIARAQEIAQGLASFARGIERKLELAELPLAPVLAEHEREMAPLALAARIQVESQLAFEGSVLANRSALLRVLSNLAKNAIEAMREGGVLRYRTALLDVGRVDIVIEDTGPGIPPALRRRLFRPFESEGKKEGCGLGLAMARDLVRSMGGEIVVDSTPGRGTAMRVQLRSAP